ncbi:MAG TPA: hypothetical protein VMR25_18830 [Planctomycetaceae bacterium]|nr:hypothetical protein [Planctomycetaceae bacterium]
MTKGWNDSHRELLKSAGYTIADGGGANLNGIARDPATGTLAHLP